MTHIYQLNKFDMQIQLHILIQNTEFIEKKYLRNFGSWKEKYLRNFGSDKFSENG